MAQRLVIDRLILRSWQIDDAHAALEVFGHLEVARWLSPIMGQVSDLPAMQLLLQQWIVEDARAMAPVGRWCIQRQEDQRVKTTYALAQWAFSQGQTKSSRSSGRATLVPPPPCAATAWS